MDLLVIALVIGFSLIGSSLGLFTGLVPGIHVNTLASLMLIAYPVLDSALEGSLPDGYTAIMICSLIMSASVVHSFVDFVPSVFIGAPDAEDAISILPGHRLLLAGKGMVAVRSAAVGSLIGCSSAILLAVPLQFAMSNGAADLLDPLTRYVILAVMGVLLWNEFRKGAIVLGIACMILSGLLGLAVMRLPIPCTGIVGIEGTLLMPMLTGLFGLPVLLESSEEGKVPKQCDDGMDPVGMVPGLKGVFMGTIAGWFPGITSTVGATVSSTMMPDRTPERFISTVASIGTVTTVLSLVTLSVSGGGRSGTVIVIGDILGDSISGFMSESFMLLLLSASMAAAIGYRLTIMSGSMATGLLSRIDQRLLNRLVICILVAMVVLTTGPWGVVILAGALLIGFVPVSCNMGKTSLCGCLLLPVVLM
jgi:putative membrane protein